MNTLTPDDLATLTARLEARRAEFGKLAQYLPELSAGVVRMAYEEIMRWEEERNGSQAERLYDLRLAEFQRGYDAAMARLEDGDDEGDVWEGDRGGHRRFASVTPKGRAISINGDPNMAPETERAIGAMMDAVYERMNGRPAAIPVTDDPEGDPPPPPDLGDDFADPQGFAEQLRDAWPEMPDLDGVDRFAEHGVSGAPDDGPADDEPDAPAEVVEKLAEVLSPATAAALGPEHTVVTPLRESPPAPAVPRLNKPRTIAEIESGLDDDDYDLDDGPKRKSGLTRARRAANEAKELAAKAAVHDAQRLVTLQQFKVEIRKMAMGTAMPTQAQFNDAKPAVWPTATALCVRHHTTWEALAEELELDYSRGRKHAGRAA